MNKVNKIYRFKINMLPDGEQRTKEEICDEHITFAIISAECYFGQAKVRLNAAYLTKEDKVVIDATTEVGDYIATIFSALLIKYQGENCFTVEKVEKDYGVRRNTNKDVKNI